MSSKKRKTPTVEDLYIENQQAILVENLSEEDLNSILYSEIPEECKKYNHEFPKK